MSMRMVPPEKAKKIAAMRYNRWAERRKDLMGKKTAWIKQNTQDILAYGAYTWELEELWRKERGHDVETIH